MEDQWIIIWVSILGMSTLLLASILQSYCEIGRQAIPSIRPQVFDTSFGWVLHIGWVVLMMTGGVLLFLANWILGTIAIVLYWLMLPLSVEPRVKKRVLPPWDEVKGDLEKLGYTQYNYWRGDWWKKGKSKETQLHSRDK